MIQLAEVGPGERGRVHGRALGGVGMGSLGVLGGHTLLLPEKTWGEHQARPRLCLPAGENREPSNLGNHVFRKAAWADPPPSSIKATAALQAHGIRV